MDELQRQAYLSALGVDGYNPRLVLPGAGISTLCELRLPSVPMALAVTASSQVVAVDATAIATVSSAAVPTMAEVAGSLRGGKNNPAMNALLDELRRDDSESPRAKTSAAVAAVPALSADPTATEPRPRFSLSIIRGAEVFIIDRGLDESVDQQAYLALLHNILLAIGAAPAKLSIDQFHWPMIKNNQVDQGETAAKQALQSFVGKQIEQLGLAYIVLMGDDAQRYLTDQAPAGEFIADPLIGGQCIVTASAAQSLHNSELKQQIWQDLTPLNRVLRKI
jgi:hypothetical protein